MPSTWDIASIRQQFPGLSRTHNGKPIAFLDGPAGSQVPQRVIDAVAECLAHRNANDSGSFATSQEVGEIANNARQAVADLIGSPDPDTIVFGPNMTTLTFALSRSMAKTWRTGDEIIVTRLDHDANVSPWTLAAADAGATVHVVDVNPTDCTLRLDQLKSMLNNRTKLVAVGVASNAVGTINPVKEIAAAAHQVGAFVFLDAVHAAAHMLLDVADLDADFLSCSAYKFFGPHVGLLWGRRNLLEQFSPYKVRPAPNSIPGRWMTGTPCFEGIAGTLAAIEYLTSLGDGPTRRIQLQCAFAAIRNHESQLARQFLDGVRRLPDWRAWGITDETKLSQRVSTFGLTHRSISAKQIAMALGEQGVNTWDGHFYALELIERLGLTPGGMLRIGLLHYNTSEEVERIIVALSQIDRA